METTEYLTTSLPYVLIVVGLLITLLILLSVKRRKDTTETKECPHCKGIVDADAIECRHCNRKVSNK